MVVPLVIAAAAAEGGAVAAAAGTGAAAAGTGAAAAGAGAGTAAAAGAETAAVAGGGAEAAAGGAARGAATGGARGAGSRMVSTEARTARAEMRAAESRQTQQGGRNGLQEEQELNESQSPESEARQEEMRRQEKVRQQIEEQANQEEEEDEQAQRLASQYQPKITGVDLIPLLIVAVIFDGIQIILSLLVLTGVGAAVAAPMNTLIGIAAYIVFGIWFALKGMNIFAGRKLVMSAAGFLVDVSFIGILPVWIATIIYCYWDEHKKARESRA